ncbi:hypothetical protein Hanom_Chr01g00089571 [Helianthus anomalus]
MARAWRITRLIWMANVVCKSIPVDQIGKILIRVLRSSTCCNVHRFHGFLMEPSGFMSPSVTKAAWFRNLYRI